MRAAHALPQAAVAPPLVTTEPLRECHPAVFVYQAAPHVTSGLSVGYFSYSFSTITRRKRVTAS